MCHAHSKGARVVLKEDVPIKDIIDPTFRASWIAKKLNLAKEQHMDGINLYIGQKVHCSTPEYDALTALVKETTEAFHREIEGSQVTVDVNWSPKHNNLSCYNYTGIADASDFVFVMSFGKRNPVGIAAANAPYKQILTGYEDYISMGINPRKLVMGVPWYGYDYTCLKLSADHVCTTTKVPLLTASYQGFSRRLVSYKVIMKYLKTSTSGIQWNEDQQAPYYNYQDSAGSFHQVWYDNPRSISLKVSYVVKNGLRGIGMWHANSLDYSEDATAKQQTEEMWQVLKPQWTFLKPKL
ncbi:di-N-acetylchitobiase [Trichechus manatus latirostris]|uniref:Di-N-acetylchitobiase n=1 Tax=Trichechus manatus latirostris TaxID=127582 RepID=A0A2Y9R6E6_TRIMA|nr:di-N-acetylchitobiase [Trichechus manatus latirostris]